MDHLLRELLVCISHRTESHIGAADGHSGSATVQMSRSVYLRESIYRRSSYPMFTDLTNSFPEPIPENSAFPAWAYLNGQCSGCFVFLAILNMFYSNGSRIQCSRCTSRHWCVSIYIYTYERVLMPILQLRPSPQLYRQARPHPQQVLQARHLPAAPLLQATHQRRLTRAPTRGRSQEV